MLTKGESPSERRGRLSNKVGDNFNNVLIMVGVTIFKKITLKKEKLFTLRKIFSSCSKKI